MSLPGPPKQAEVFAAVMTSRAKLLVIEQVLSQDATPSLGKRLDLNMRLLPGASSGPRTSSGDSARGRGSA